MTVEVVRKAIKNLHLGVYPPHGRVRVAAPLAVSDEAVRLAVIGKLGWIKRQQAKFEAQPRQSRTRDGQRREPLFPGAALPAYASSSTMGRPELYCVASLRSICTFAQDRAPNNASRCCLRWYREQLKALIPPLLEKWQPVLGVQVADWGIKKMKTKWGSLQRQRPANLAEPRTGQEAGAVPGVHRRPRTGASDGAASQRSLPNVDGSIHAPMAAPPGCS